jgi:hypothetical protein
VAVAIAQQVSPAYLLQSSQWRPQGWSVVKGPTTLRQISVYNDGSLVPGQPDLIVEGFEWDDLQGWGIGGSDGGLSQLRAAIQQRGSDLYAYALLRRDVANFLGIRITSYRLVLLHSAVALLGWALLILAATFAAVIFIQYLTTGRAPALDDLNRFFAGLFKSVGDAGGAIASGAAQPFVWLMLAGGVAAIAFALAERQVGVKTGYKPKLPSASVGVKTGAVSTRVGS